jgi:glutathione S-transferase
MKLHQSLQAPNPRRVRIFLFEKGLSVPMVNVDLGKLEQRTPEFHAINAFETIPVLELDDGTMIGESIAICRFFEEAQPLPALFGADARQRVDVEMWQRRVEFQLFLPIAQAFRHSHPAMAAMESPQVPDWCASCKAKALLAMERFDGALEGRPFIAGDAFSVADITGLVALDWARYARIAIPGEFKNLNRWHADLKGRPSAKA